MALDYTNLYPDTSNNGAFTKSWNYTALSSADTMATISAAGFFNKVATRLGIGDNINVAIVDAFDKSRTALVDYNVLYVTAIAGGVVTTIAGSITNPLNISDGVRSVVYSQSETGAVSSPLIRRLNNTLFASEFGAVGDGSANDYARLQAFLTALGTSGKEGRLDPGKKYYVSGGDLALTSTTNAANVALYGNGATIKTDPTQFRTGLTVRRGTILTREDQGKQIIIDGLTVDQFNDDHAVCGINADGGNLVAIRGCTILNGSEGGITPYGNYIGISLGQSNPLNFDTGAQLATVDHCVFMAGATRMPVCIGIAGQSNGARLTGNSFGGDVGVMMTTANGASIVVGDDFANSVLIHDNYFEDCGVGVYILDYLGSPATIQGLQIYRNRVEATTGLAFFLYAARNDSLSPPILGPNWVLSSTYMGVTSGLRVDVRDEYVGDITFDPASLAAGATRAETTHTLTVYPATAGDRVRVETTADLQGITATGYVSAASTVTIRLTNPTSGAVDLPSMQFTVRVRPHY